MIAKAVKGKGFRGALAYDLGKDGGELIDTNMAGQTVPELASEFGAARKLRPNLEKAVLHVSISAAPGEKLTDRQWEQIGHRYLAGMDLVDHQYLITRHTDTDHEHIHILANRISIRGEVASDSHDWRRQEVLMRAIEWEFKLQPVAPSLDAERRALTQGEIEKQIRTGEVSTRAQLQQLCDVAAKDCDSYTKYQTRLERSGVELIPTVQLQGVKLSGLMYRLDAVVMKGSDLGKGYSPLGLAKRGVSYEQGRDAEAIRRSQEREAGRAAAGAADPDRAREPGAERGGAEREPGAAGQGVGSAQRQRGPDAGTDRRREPESKRGDGRSGGRRDQGPPSSRQLEPSGQPAQHEPLPDGKRSRGPDRSGERGAHERILALGPAADRERAIGREGGGRATQSGRAREANAQPIAASRTPIDFAQELARRTRERDQKVQQVLVKAQRRQVRREELLKQVAAKAPQAPKGLLASLQRKSHQQAIVAWDSAKLAAGRLVKQARALVERVRQAATSERVAEWAYGVVERAWPGATAALREQQRQAVRTKTQWQPEHRPTTELPSRLLSLQPTSTDREMDLARFDGLRRAAAQRTLTMDEQIELVNGWDRVAELVTRGEIGFGGKKAGPAALEHVNEQRQAAHRRLASSVFAVMPRQEGLRIYAELAVAYDLLEQEDRAINSSGLSSMEQVQQHKRARDDIAAAIDRGPQRKESDQGRQRGPQVQPERSHDIGRDREGPER